MSIYIPDKSVSKFYLYLFLIFYFWRKRAWEKSKLFFPMTIKDQSIGSQILSLRHNNRQIYTQYI